MNEIIKEELQRIADDLKKIIDIVEKDSQKDKDRYHIGVLVGIGYAKRELDRVVNRRIDT